MKNKRENGEMMFKELSKMSIADNYASFIFNHTKPFIGDRVLEIGGGIGTFTKFLLKVKLLVTTDISDKCIKIISQKFKKNKNVIILKSDITKDNLNGYKFDTVICLNLMEHIEHESLVLSNIYSVMEKNSYLIILVPALKPLFSDWDKNVGHFRRYTKKELYLVLNKFFKIKKIHYFNLLGAIGWFINVRIFKKKEISMSQLSLFNWLVPFLYLENFFKVPFGLSLFAICQK